MVVDLGLVPLRQIFEGAKPLKMYEPCYYKLDLNGLADRVGTQKDTLPLRALISHVNEEGNRNEL